jgi:hypothetical protein
MDDNEEFERQIQEEVLADWRDMLITGSDRLAQETQKNHEKSLL